MKQLILILAIFLGSCQILPLPNQQIVLPPWNITGWTELNSFSHDFVPTFTDGEFSIDGLFYIANDSDAPALYRFPLTIAWDISTISPKVDQIDPTPFITDIGFTFGNNGTYFYWTPVGGLSFWRREPLGMSYDLTTFMATDEIETISNSRFMLFNSIGSKFWSFTGDTMEEYTASANWSIVAPGVTTTDVNMIIAPDGLELKAFLFGDEGTKLYILKSQSVAPFQAVIYQSTCFTPYEIATAAYDGVSVTFNGNDEVFTFQFNPNGERFYTTEGLAIQTIREFGM